MRRHEGDLVPRDFQILFVILWHNLICVKFSHIWCIKAKANHFKTSRLESIWTYCEYLNSVYCFMWDTIWMVRSRLREKIILSPSFYILCVSPQVQSTSWMPHQQYVMQPTVSTSPFTCSSCPRPAHSRKSIGCLQFLLSALCFARVVERF